MTDSKLSLSRCTDLSYWDSFVASSPQDNVFCRTGFLNALEVEYDLWFVLKDSEPEVGAVILRRGNEVLPAPYAFSMYQGILLSQGIAAQPPHERYKSIPEVFEFMLTELSTNYSRLSLCLHYTLDDLRGLQWFHYNEPQLGQVKMDLYYTGLVNLAAHSDFEVYLATIRKVRRYEYRRALRQGLTVEVSGDIDTLDHLHRLTFERQGLERSEEAARLLQTITAAALACGFGELLLCRNAAGEVASATLFLHDQHCGYYLFGANHPAHRGAGSGTFLLLENVRRCYDRGLRWVDVCGINSPNRGDFKTSLNVVPVPYFVANWERPPR